MFGDTKSHKILVKDSKNYNNKSQCMNGQTTFLTRCFNLIHHSVEKRKLREGLQFFERWILKPTYLTKWKIGLKEEQSEIHDTDECCNPSGKKLYVAERQMQTKRSPIFIHLRKRLHRLNTNIISPTVCPHTHWNVRKPNSCDWKSEVGTSQNYLISTNITRMLSSISFHKQWMQSHEYNPFNVEFPALIGDEIQIEEMNWQRKFAIQWNW